MFCVKCGNRIDAGAGSCSVCGTPVPLKTDVPDDGAMENITKNSNTSAVDHFDESVELLDGEREAQVLEEIELSLLLAEVDEEIAMRKAGGFSDGFNSMGQGTDGVNATYDDDGRTGDADENGDAADDVEDIDIESRPEKRKYQQTGKERRAAYQTKTRAIKAKTKKKSVQVTIAAIVILMAALCVVGWIIADTFRGSEEERFIRAIEAYEAAMTENASDFGAYQYLLKEAKQALEDGDTEAFRNLTKRMEEAIEQMTGEMESRMALSELKDYYNKIFANYQITDSYKAAYDDLMARLDQAIEDRDDQAARELKKELHTMRINLGNENQNLVQTKINEINKMNIPQANASENARIEAFKEKLDVALAEENFTEALSILDDWYDTALQIETRILKEAEEEKARYEEESRIQAARESEEAAKRESEEAAKRESEAAAESQNTSTQNPPAASNDYIIADSSTRYLTESDVSGLSAWEKRLARNEIYARHGRKFNNADIQAYFNSQSWYNGTIAPSDFSESLLSDIEKKNIALISSLE